MASNPGAVMEIQSYHAMQACVASGARVALLPLSVLEQLPGRERVKVHPLPRHIADAATWLIWRRDAFGPNVEPLKQLIIELHDATTGDTVSAPAPAGSSVSISIPVNSIWPANLAPPI